MKDKYVSEFESVPILKSSKSLDGTYTTYRTPIGPIKTHTYIGVCMCTGKSKTSYTIS